MAALALRLDAEPDVQRAGHDDEAAAQQREDRGQLGPEHDADQHRDEDAEVIDRSEEGGGGKAEGMSVQVDGYARREPQQPPGAILGSGASSPLPSSPLRASTRAFCTL